MAKGDAIPSELSAHELRLCLRKRGERRRRHRLSFCAAPRCRLAAGRLAGWGRGAQLPEGHRQLQAVEGARLGLAACLNLLRLQLRAPTRRQPPTTVRRHVVQLIHRMTPPTRSDGGVEGTGSTQLQDYGMAHPCPAGASLA